jgi:hypothetical protein
MSFSKIKFVIRYSGKVYRIGLILIDHFWHLGQKCVPLPPTFIFFIEERQLLQGEFYCPYTLRICWLDPLSRLEEKDFIVVPLFSIARSIIIFPCLTISFISAPLSLDATLYGLTFAANKI